ncbi:MAG: hypothetical protein Q9207_005810, partial [Kuettlingeria erythrocarpa]
MRTSYYLTRFLTLLLCVVFPLYLALRASAWLSDVRSLFSPLSERAKALHVVLTSPLTAARASFSKEALEASPEPAEPVRAPESGRRKEHLSSLPDGLAHCINSLEQYPFLAEQVLQRKHARYAKQTPAQQTISNKLGYPAHFEKAREGIEVNARFSQQLAQMTREDYRTGPRSLEDAEEAEFGVVNQMFGHLVRDWSTQGAKERQTAFPPVLDALEQHSGGKGNGREKRVLVPGSGYDVTANELDYGSILAYHLLTNHTSSLHQHILQPFVTKWTHQANPSSRYSTLTVPDRWPNKAVKLVEGDFLDIFPRDGEFDAVATLFFIDMSENVVDFLSNIHRLLKPGGVWINLGPLKWGAHSALQLSAEEVLQLADLLGFDVDHTSRKSIDSQYAEQPDTLLKFTY